MAAKSGSNVDLYLGMRVTSPARDPRADRESVRLHRASRRHGELALPCSLLGDATPNVKTDRQMFTNMQENTTIIYNSQSP